LHTGQIIVFAGVTGAEGLAPTTIRVVVVSGFVVGRLTLGLRFDHTRIRLGGVKGFICFSRKRLGCMELEGCR
jgi:hypothetical protein